MSGFTAIPNEILDNMANLSPAEFKVVMAIYRLIVGYREYRKDGRRVISISQLESMCDLSRQGVLNAFVKIQELGYARKTTEGRTTVWEIDKNTRVVNSVDQDTDIVKSVDQQPAGVVNSVDKVVNTVDHDSQITLPATSSSKQILETNEIKEREEGESPLPPAPANPFPFKPSPTRPAVTSPAQERVNALIAVCGLDSDIPDHVSAAENAAAQLGKKYTAADLLKRYAYQEQPNGTWYWYRDDWRGERGDMPTLRAVVETVAKERKPTNGRPQSDNRSNPTPPRRVQLGVTVRTGAGVAISR